MVSGKSGVTRRAVGEAYIFTKCKVGPEMPNTLMPMNSQEKLNLSKAFSTSSEIMAVSWSERILANSKARRTVDIKGGRMSWDKA